jgi:hypothetical protein
MENNKKKPDYDRLSESVQVLLKKSEYKNLDRLRRESPFPTIASYVRYLILENCKKKSQTELL